MSSLEAQRRRAGGSLALKTAALMRMLRGIIEAGRRQSSREQLEPMLRNMAVAVGRCSPEMLLGLMAHAAGPTTRRS